MAQATNKAGVQSAKLVMTDLGLQQWFQILMPIEQNTSWLLVPKHTISVNNQPNQLVLILNFMFCDASNVLSGITDKNAQL